LFPPYHIDVRESVTVSEVSLRSVNNHFTIFIPSKQSTQAMSSVRGKASKYRGVYKCGRKWKSQVRLAATYVDHLIAPYITHTQIQIDGVQHYLGIFETEAIAASKYNEAAAGLGRLENVLPGEVEDQDPSSSISDALASSNQIGRVDSNNSINGNASNEVEMCNNRGNESIVQMMTTMDSCSEDGDGRVGGDREGGGGAAHGWTLFLSSRSPKALFNLISLHHQNLSRWIWSCS
jgi:hypothetical protein